MEWIKVTDKLPETHNQHGREYSSGKVLVYGKEGCDILEYICLTEDGTKHIKSYW